MRISSCARSMLRLRGCSQPPDDFGGVHGEPGTGSLQLGIGVVVTRGGEAFALLVELVTDNNILATLQLALLAGAASSGEGEALATGLALAFARTSVRVVDVEGNSLDVASDALTVLLLLPASGANTFDAVRIRLPGGARGLGGLYLRWRPIDLTATSKHINAPRPEPHVTKALVPHWSQILKAGLGIELRVVVAHATARDHVAFRALGPHPAGIVAGDLRGDTVRSVGELAASDKAVQLATAKAHVAPPLTVPRGHAFLECALLIELADEVLHASTKHEVSRRQCGVDHASVGCVGPRVNALRTLWELIRQRNARRLPTVPNPHVASPLVAVGVAFLKHTGIVPLAVVVDDATSHERGATGSRHLDHASVVAPDGLQTWSLHGSLDLAFLGLGQLLHGDLLRLLGFGFDDRLLLARMLLLGFFFSALGLHLRLAIHLRRHLGRVLLGELLLGALLFELFLVGFVLFVRLCCLLLHFGGFLLEGVGLLVVLLVRALNFGFTDALLLRSLLLTLFLALLLFGLLVAFFDSTLLAGFSSLLLLL